MIAHLVQFDIAWEDPDANRDRVERMLDDTDVGEGDLVLLPELFDSGFSMNTERTHDGNGATRAMLQCLADDLGCYVQGGRTLRTCSSCLAQNVATTFGPGGEPLCEYQKVHPFSFGKEAEHFAGGNDIKLWDWAGVRVCPAICYDLRFPELFRFGAIQGAELFALGANWPSARHEHWRLLTIARAIENQAIMLCCNRTGSDPHLDYLGGSIAVDHMGSVLGELGTEEAVLTIELDIATQRRWREQFKALADIRLLTHAQTRRGVPMP